MSEATPKPLRTLAQVRAEYTQVATQAGDLFFKIKDLETHLQSMRQSLNQLDARRTQLAAEAANAPNELAEEKVV